MLAITSLDGSQVEPLARYNNYEKYEEVNGTLELSFTSFSVENNPGFDLLKEEAVVTDEDGYEYRIKQITSNDKRKSIKGLSTYFDLVGSRKYDIFGGTKTLNEFLDWLLSGTGWTYENLDVTHSTLVPNFGNENVVKLMQILLSAFECEMKIGPNKTLIFANKIGPDNDAQYRYGHNVRALSHHVDTTKLRTSIKGYGGNGLEVTYVSPNASKFPQAGEAEPVHDDRYTIPDSMVERLKRELMDHPETSIELDDVELQNKELGERVWLIYEPLGIEFQTRVIAKTERIPKAKSSVTLGNIKPGMSDILTQVTIDIDENKKETRSRFDQTNERINLAVERFDGELIEAYSFIELTADGIRQEVGNEFTRIDGVIAAANASITTIAGEISAKAERSEVSALGNRVWTAEQSISALDGSISNKVSYTDYTGETIASLINQTAGSVKIKANNIELDGITTVARQLNIGGAGVTGRRDLYFDGAYGSASRISSSSSDLSISNLYGTYIETTNGDIVLDAPNGSVLIYGNHNIVAKFG